MLLEEAVVGKESNDETLGPVRGIRFTAEQEEFLFDYVRRFRSNLSEIVRRLVDHGRVRVKTGTPLFEESVPEPGPTMVSRSRKSGS